MKYYVTIYIDEFFEKELYKNVDFSLVIELEFSKLMKQIDFTHAFLGLTKDKTPDELEALMWKKNLNGINLL